MVILLISSSSIKKRPIPATNMDLIAMDIIDFSKGICSCVSANLLNVVAVSLAICKLKLYIITVMLDDFVEKLKKDAT